MKVLENIWSEFGEREKNAFRDFMVRKNAGKARKSELTYLDSMGEKGRISNKDAAVRKRITKELARFIGLNESDDDQSESMGRQQLSMAVFLLDRKYMREGWNVLRKVETLAESNKYYRLLNDVCITMMDYANTEFAYSVGDIIERKTKAEKRRKEDEDIKIQLALIREWLYREKVQGNKGVVGPLIQRVREIQEQTYFYDHPQHVLSLIEIARNVFLAARNLALLGEMINGEYERVFATDDIARKYPVIHARFLYILAHWHYRMLTFDECDMYMKKLMTVAEGDKRLMKVYRPKIVALRVSIRFLTGDLEGAYTRLRDFFSQQSQLSVKDSLNMHLTLVTLLAYQHKHTEANKYFINFHHSDGWCAKKMGREWVMRKNIIHAMLLYDLGENDQALKEIRHVISDFQDMFRNHYYFAVKLFLKVIEDFMTESGKVTAKEVAILESRAESDTKKLAYLCWLKAHVSGKDFYTVTREVFLNVLKRQSNL